MDVDVLELADFDWVKPIDKIWGEDPTDVADIHHDVRVAFDKALTRLAHQTDSASPKGWVLTGPGGSGKTHLLGAMCRETLARDGYFVIVDMSGIKEFWDTLLLHTVRSIRTAGPDGKPQLLRLLGKIVDAAGGSVDAEALPSLFRDDLAAAIDKTIKSLYRRYEVQTQEYQDVLRAAILLASEDMDLSDYGRQWLLGLRPDADAIKTFGFKNPVCGADSAVAGLSWLMSLENGFSVFALDQLDGIVKQHYVPEIGDDSGEALTAKRIIAGLGTGLLSLRDNTRRSLVVVSCLNDTWTYMREVGLATAHARYDRPIRLSALTSEKQAELLVASRMLPAFAKAGATPPYPTWPFPPAVLAQAAQSFPRALLQYCDKHIQTCIAEGEAREATGVDDGIEPVAGAPETELQDHLAAMDARYQEAFSGVDPEACKTKDREDGFWHDALATYARAFRYEHPPMADADIVLDEDDFSDRKYPLLHAKLRYENIGGSARDRQLCLRALLQTHHAAFRTRLKAAMTQSGIDRSLSFRKLVMIHFGKFPGGKVVKELLDQYTKLGGYWLRPSDNVIRCLAGLVAVEKEYPAEFRDWVGRHKPVEKCGFLNTEFHWLVTGSAPAPVPEKKEADRAESPEPEAEEPEPAPEQSAPPKEDEAPAEDVEQTVVVEIAVDPDVSPPSRKTSGIGRKMGDASAAIPVGRRVVGGVPGENVYLTLETLKRHVAILAGSGSGKTVLTRRLVEEAALCGTPSIVIDVANDLSRLGQRWPEPPEGWTDEDRRKAERYFEEVEVKIWTPGRSGGNPLHLRQIPDLAAVADDEEELGNAVAMSLGALRGILNTKSEATREGIVAAVLRWMARNGGGVLRRLSSVLSDLPADSGAMDIHPNAAKWSVDMAGRLKGAMLTNPLLGSDGKVTDMAELLTGTGGKTRISVINLSGLGQGQPQQDFVNQLAMTLFGWIKEHPVEGLGGILVMDEAKDFVPSVKATPCKESIVRYAAQARKYGMGLILATQEPKSVDHKIIANCNTQFFGRQNSPAAAEAAEDLLQKRHVVTKLGLGNFFLKSVGLDAEPSRIVAPLCLSHHSPAPLDPGEVLELARMGPT